MKQKSYVKDKRSGIIIGNDDSYYEYILHRRKDDEKFKALEAEIDEMKILIRKLINN